MRFAIRSTSVLVAATLVVVPIHSAVSQPASLSGVRSTSGGGSQDSSERDLSRDRTSYEEIRGELADGTPYLIRVPDDWNGTVIRDLDYASRPEGAWARYLQEQGYALAGTRRHRLRSFQYDPAREIRNLDRVLDLFVERFGEPERVIQFGCSGGGHVTLAIAEDFPERVDGAIALGAHTPVWLMNTFLDGWFVLKALLAPDLPIVDLPVGASGGSAHDMGGQLVERWAAAVNRAQTTAKGRARIALAFTIGQWPAWVNRLTRRPEFTDVGALQHSMYHALLQNTANPGGEARILFESAAMGQQLSWNDGMDYRRLFENGNPHFKRVVRELYEEAGVDLQADLKRVNEFPRVTADSFALDFWSADGRTVRGETQIPVLRMHELGDYQVPPSLLQGYGALVRRKGRGELYRSAVVDGTGHCDFTAAEVGAAVEAMNRRLDRGEWGRTSPEGLNALADSLPADTLARFVPFGDHRQQEYNRTWLPR